MAQQWTPPPLNATAPAPNNNLVFAIIATVLSVVFCCLPHGLISLIFALQVNGKAAAGDLQGAMNSAKQAKLWAIISIVVSLVWLVIALVFGVLNAVMTSVRY
ncbi:MAG: CD225/dispanin family protein [Acidobacteriota bacterium]